MATKITELAEAILKLIEDNPSPKQAAQAVASYLVAERRTRELSSLLRQLEELRYKKDGTLEVTATTAHPLSEASKDLIKKIFAPKQNSDKIMIHETIDNNALGGVRARALDKVADFSVQARLQRLRNGENVSVRRHLLRTGRNI